MKFAMGFSNDLRDKIIEQVFESCFANFPITEDDVDSMEVYFDDGITLTINLTLIKGGTIEIGGIFHNNFDFLQWDLPEMRN
jgi:hypothetical protein